MDEKFRRAGSRGQPPKNRPQLLSVLFVGRSVSSRDVTAETSRDHKLHWWNR